MDSIFRGDLATRRGRRLAWLDSMLVDHGVFRLVWTNFAPVIPGRLYRSNHPTPGRLAAFARRHGLRSLVNLRGATGNGSDALSRETAARLGLHFIDLPMKSRAAPQRDHVLRLAEIFRTMAEPALIHCKSGADRAGFAAAVFVLLADGGSAAALRQLSLRYGHFRRSPAGLMDAFVHRYAQEAEGRMPFLDWVRDAYDEAALRRDFAAGGLSVFLNDRLLRRE
jgi:protein tyrosine/serine phosphatase